MKKILVILLLIGCDSSVGDVINNNDTFTCSWSYKYSVCFCGDYNKTWGPVFTWVPDKVCGK